MDWEHPTIRFLPHSQRPPNAWASLHKGEAFLYFGNFSPLKPRENNPSTTFSRLRAGLGSKLGLVHFFKTSAFNDPPSSNASLEERSGMIFFVAIAAAAALVLGGCSNEDAGNSASSQTPPDGGSTSPPDAGTENPPQPNSPVSPNSDTEWKAKYGYYNVDVDPKVLGVQTRLENEENAIAEFNKLSLRDQALLFHTLAESGKNGGSTNEFLQNALGFRFTDSGLERIRSNLKKAKDLAGNRDDPSYFTQRYAMDRLMFQIRQDYQNYSTYIEFNPGVHRTVREEIGQALVKVYSASAVNGKSPLFDTDGDGFFDYSPSHGGNGIWQDQYPLNTYLDKDIDQDRIPDFLDSDFWDPERNGTWERGKTYKVGEWEFKDKEGIVYNKIFYTLTFPLEGDRLKITLPLYLHPYTKAIEPELEKKKVLWKKQIEDYYNAQFNKYYQVDFEVQFLSAPSVQYRTIEIREGKSYVEFSTTWFLDIKLNPLCHEVSHLLGIPDRYHDLGFAVTDRTFTPGFHFLVTEGDLMGRCPTVTPQPCQLPFSDLVSIMRRAAPAVQLREKGLDALRKEDLDQANFYFKESLKLEPSSVSLLYLRRIEEFLALRKTYDQRKK